MFLMDDVLLRNHLKKQSFSFGAVPSSPYEHSQAVCLIPFPYDSTNVTIGTAKKGPDAILRASRNLELFDSELGVETYKVGLQTMGEVESNVNSPFENSQVVEAVVTEALQSDKLPVVIGGDHSLTIGSVCAIHDKYPNVGVVILDAHPDLFDEYEGTKYGHASVARRVHELDVPLSLAGVRSASREESDFINNSEINLITAREILESKKPLDRILSMLPEHIYLSIDLDVIDPGEMPAVANPEPGGLRWYDIVDCLTTLTSERTVVGFDVVELCPIPGNPTPDFIAAKLIYRIIGLIFKDKLMSSDVKKDQVQKVGG